MKYPIGTRVRYTRSLGFDQSKPVIGIIRAYNVSGLAIVELQPPIKIEDGGTCSAVSDKVEFFTPLRIKLK